MPKIMYTLRTTDPTNHQLCWQRCDFITREAITRILGRQLDNQQWQQAVLPTTMGGLGLSCGTLLLQPMPPLCSLLRI